MKKKGFIAALLLVCFVLSSCVTTTMVNFNSDIPGAEVIVDGEILGQTPFKAEVSNAIWKNQEVIVKKNGLKDLHTILNKEPKVFNIVSAIIFPGTVYLPLLWCYGPKENQYFTLGQAD